MALIHRFSARLLRRSFRPAHARFLALTRLDRAAFGRDEERRLLQLLAANQATRIARRFPFAALISFAEYQANVPVSDAHTLRADIARIAQGTPAVLSASPLKRLEPTSGSTAGPQLIPYTEALAAEFQEGLGAWLYDLYGAFPELSDGPSYWSVTPIGDRPARTAAGIPIGFDDEAAYFGRLARHLLRPMLLSDPDLVRTTDMDAFYLRTGRLLLDAPDLRLFSFWHPSLLLRYLDVLRTERAHFRRELTPDRRRAFDRALAEDDWTPVWPDLRVISAWADAGAAGDAARVRARFPRAHFQPKGLLATEAFMSFPWTADPGDPVLAAHAHIFEFEDPETGTLTRTADTETGRTYRLRVTTGGGFYRYTTDDLVRVTGHLGPIPRLRFVGRAGIATDLHGEKLSERLVLAALEHLPADLRPHLLLAPAPSRTHYILWLRPEAPELSDDACTEISRTLDTALCANYHYAYARRLGQLAPLTADRLAPDWPLREAAAWTAAGRRLGDFKRPVLRTEPVPRGPDH